MDYLPCMTNLAANKCDEQHVQNAHKYLLFLLKKCCLWPSIGGSARVKEFLTGSVL